MKVEVDLEGIEQGELAWIESGPPSPPVKNFAVEEQPSFSGDGLSKQTTRQRKSMNKGIWFLILGACVVGVVALATSGGKTTPDSVSFSQEASGGLQDRMSSMTRKGGKGKDKDKGKDDSEDSEDDSDDDDETMADCKFASGGARIISEKELKKHKKKNDCWVAIHGMVYDLTSFAQEHPGGAKLITKLAGKDGTSKFEKEHPPSMLDTLQNGELQGVLEGSEYADCNPSDPPVASPTTTVPDSTPDSTPDPKPDTTPVPTPEPTPVPTPDPTAGPGPGPDPTLGPDSTPRPTPEPTPNPTPDPTPNPTPEPTPRPTPEPTPRPTPEPTPNAGISIAELATHSTNDDCWTAIHGNVYDLTLYANVHPGGAFFITRNCGIDGTADYDKFHLPALLGILRDGELQGPLASRRRRFLKGKKGKGKKPGKKSKDSEDESYDGEDGMYDTGVGGGVGGSTGSSGRVVSSSELQMHNRAGDCWVALHGSVYDLTLYANVHPGGAIFVTRNCGIDGTADYDKFHLPALLGILRDGELQGEFGEKVTGGDNNSSNNNNDTGGGNGGAISFQELEKHNTADDCWIAMHGNVYDLTNYANRHPGGARIITRLAGTDGTIEYRKFHSAGLLGTLRNGELIGPFEGGSQNTGSDTGGVNWDDDESVEESMESMESEESYD